MISQLYLAPTVSQPLPFAMNSIVVDCVISFVPLVFRNNWEPSEGFLFAVVLVVRWGRLLCVWAEELGANSKADVMADYSRERCDK